AVTALMLGHLTASPTALALVPRLAAGRGTGAYFGLLASCGGAAVLLGSAGAGRLLEVAGAHPAAAPLPWLLLTALPVVPALLVPRVLAARLIPRVLAARLIPRVLAARLTGAVPGARSR